MPGDLVLRPLSPKEFSAYRSALLGRYAADLERAESMSPERAVMRAQSEVDALLVEGAATPGHWIQTIHAPGVADPVGTIWYARLTHAGEPFVFIYDLWIDPEARGAGLGRQAMARIEAHARELGIQTVRFHVFGHNEGVRRFFERLGYIVTSLYMWKTLSSNLERNLDAHVLHLPRSRDRRHPLDPRHRARNRP